MQSSTTYQELSNSYSSQIRNLFLAPENIGVGEEMRGGSAVPLQILVERAEALAETSQQLGESTTIYLSDETASTSQQEAAEMKLLAQAIAELEAAQALLESAEDAKRDIKRGKIPVGSDEPSRGVKINPRVQASIENSAIIVETPLEAGVPLFSSDDSNRSGLPSDLAGAKTTLQRTVESSLRAICKDTSRVGWRAINDLLLMDAAAMRQGLAFVSKDAAQLIDQMVEGAGSFILRLVKTAIRLLGQAYNWVRAILGQEIEAEGRKQVGGWLDELKQDGSEEGLFGKLVPQIYKTAVIQTELQGLLESTQADITQINQATEVVDSLAKRHQAKAKQVEQLLIVLAFIKKIPALKTPQGTVIIAAVTTGITCYILYLGNDHIRDGQIVLNEHFSFRIPDRVVGVRETVQKALGIVLLPTSNITPG
ncbi:hypothetical protein IQ277_15025 [Nostocales cyanobacterium LEGE 12452]|nr:hypothetical protein [Nostocales cyanobacterium LEGE 12452]